MTCRKSLSIILPSFNDFRILRAIESIRRFDDINAVKILIIDGGSAPEIIKSVKLLLKEADVFISEPDEGIFDALNKGLRICDSEFIGWLGSDDMFTGLVLSSEVIGILKKYDLLVADLYFFNNGYVTRKTSAWP